MAGVVVDLDDGWKTYWRVPGDAGIPPEFKWDGSRNARSVEVRYPLPRRFVDQSGEAIGYKHRVVFPVEIDPSDTNAPVGLSFQMFFGVCSEVCVPQKFSVAIALPPDGVDRGVAEWLAKVPQADPAAPLVAAARLETKGGATRIVLSLNNAVDDIFVETPGDAYFHRPQFSGHEGVLAISNATAETLHGAALKLTLVRGDRGVEQRISLP